VPDRHAVGAAEIPAGLVDIVGPVQLDGGSAVRHFVVDGGELTLVDVTLTNRRHTPVRAVSTGRPAPRHVGV
jgi:hypothetical protein